MCILASILVSIGGIFLKLVTSHSPLMHYKRLKFHCYLSLNKATVLGKEFVFLAVPQLPLERFTCKISPWTPMHALQRVQALLWVVNTWRAMYPFCCILASMQSIFLKLRILNSLHMCNISLVWIGHKLRALYLKSNVFFNCVPLPFWIPMG